MATTIEAAADDATRAGAKAKLAAIQKKQAEVQTALSAAKAAAEKAEEAKDATK